MPLQVAICDPITIIPNQNNVWDLVAWVKVFTVSWKGLEKFPTHVRPTNFPAALLKQAEIGAGLKRALIFYC